MLAARLRKMDDVVDELYTAVKLYLTQISREALDEGGRRWTDIVSFTINLRAGRRHRRTGDHRHRGQEDRQGPQLLRGRHRRDLRPARSADRQPAIGPCGIPERRPQERAGAPRAEGVVPRPRACVRRHASRAARRQYAREHRDVVAPPRPDRRHARINSHVCSIAYPILEEAGVFARTRLKEPVARRCNSTTMRTWYPERCRPTRSGPSTSRRQTPSFSDFRLPICSPASGARLRRRAAAAAETSAPKRHARGGLGSVSRHHHGGIAARPRPSAARPRRYADAARHRRRPPVRRAAVPALAVRRRRAPRRSSCTSTRSAGCARRARDYYGRRCSVDSQRSLALQGGVLCSKDEADAFIALPHARDAVRTCGCGTTRRSRRAPTPSPRGRP